MLLPLSGAPGWHRDLALHGATRAVCRHHPNSVRPGTMPVTGGCAVTCLIALALSWALRCHCILALRSAARAVCQKPYVEALRSKQL